MLFSQPLKGFFFVSFSWRVSRERIARALAALSTRNSKFEFFPRLDSIKSKFKVLEQCQGRSRVRVHVQVRSAIRILLFYITFYLSIYNIWIFFSKWNRSVCFLWPWWIMWCSFAKSFRNVAEKMLPPFVDLSFVPNYSNVKVCQFNLIIYPPPLFGRNNYICEFSESEFLNVYAPQIKL